MAGSGPDMSCVLVTGTEAGFVGGQDNVGREAVNPSVTLRSCGN